MALNIEIRDYSKKEFTKTKYFIWTPGQHIIRILDEDIPRVTCYWFGTAYVQALGFDDPQAMQNKRIKLENPETFKQIKGYRPPSDRYFVNVLDRSVVKICPSCQSEIKSVNGVFPLVICPVCAKGNLSGVSIAPLNQVRVLSGGKTLFEQFITLQNSNLLENGEPRGVQNFDIILYVVGTGNQRSTVAVATTNFDAVEVSPEQKFDTTKQIAKGNEEEMEQLLRGVVLRDIFAARRSTDVISQATSTESSGIDSDEIRRKVDNLFA